MNFLAVTTIEWLDAVIAKLLETDNNFAIFLVIVILAVIVVTGGLVSLFFLLVTEKNKRIVYLENEKKLATKQLSTQNDNLQKKIDEREEEFHELLEEQTRYLEQVKNVIANLTLKINELFLYVNCSKNQQQGGNANDFKTS